jgi:hypothetical protein
MKHGRRIGEDQQQQRVVILEQVHRQHIARDASGLTVDIGAP